MASKLTIKEKISIFSKLFIYWLILLLVNFSKKKEIKQKKLLIIKPDAIGDYILFRNFLEPVREHYNSYHIIFCANIIYKDLVLNFDTDLVDQTIWIDHNKFSKNLIYRYKFLKDIQKLNVEIAFQPRYARAAADPADHIIHASQANEKIGGPGDLFGSRFHKRFYASYYTKIIYGKQEVLFEFERNREFFEDILKRKIEIKKPELKFHDFHLDIDLPKSFVVLFPGAGIEFRRWSPSKFAKIAEMLTEEFSFKVIIAGSKAECNLGQQITKICNNDNILDYTGKFSLTEFSRLISRASLLISNETAAVHISVAVNTPVVCISNGNHFGRFTPYPEEIFEHYYPAYPPEIMENLQNVGMLKDLYGKGSDLDINDISIETVYEVVKEALKVKAQISNYKI